MGTFKPRKASGFTLIELLVVVIIIAVLAAVGVPLLSANIERSQMTEAEASLGNLRTQTRAYIVENNAFPANIGATGVLATDFNNQFFEFDDFSYLAGGTTTDYCIIATGDTAGTAPSGSKVNGKSRSMDENGTIFKTANCT